MAFSYRKNIISSLVTQYGNTLIGFFNSIVITRILTGYGRGEMALYTNFVALTVLFFGFSLTTGIVYFISSKRISPKNILQLTFTYFGAASAVVLLVIVAFAKFNKLELLLPATSHNAIIIAFCIIGFFLNSMTAVFTGVYNGLKQIHHYNRVFLFFNLISFATLLLIYVGGAYVSQNAFLVVVSVQLFFQLVQFSLLMYYLLTKHGRHEEAFGAGATLRHSFASLFRFSTLIYATNLLSFFTYKLDVWIVNYYQGKTELGIYSLAVSLAQMVWLLPNAIAFVNLSEVAGKDNQSRSLQLTASSYKMVFYSTIFIAIFFYMFCYFFVPVLFGAEFTQVPWYLLLLFIGVVPFAPASIISSYLAGINRFRHNFYASVVGVALCIGLDFTLIPRIGVAGACIASSISYLAIVVYLTCYLKNIGGLRYKDLFVITREEKQRMVSFVSNKIARRTKEITDNSIRPKPFKEKPVE